MTTQIVKATNPEPKKKDFDAFLVPLLVSVCHGVSVVAWFGVMRSLTNDLTLAIAYAMFLGLGISTVLGLVFERSAWTSKAIEILLKSPGGMLIVALTLALAGVIYLVQPVLIDSGYSPFVAIAATVLAQIPMAMYSTIFSSRFLLRVFNEQYYARALDAVFREMQAKRLLEHAQIIKNTVEDALELSKGKPFEPQLKDLLNTATLRISNMKSQIEWTCERHGAYAPPQYHKMLDEVAKELRVRLCERNGEKLDLNTKPDDPFAELWAGSDL
jgi:hypothetical protein